MFIENTHLMCLICSAYRDNPQWEHEDATSSDESLNLYAYFDETTYLSKRASSEYGMSETENTDTNSFSSQIKEDPVKVSASSKRDRLCSQVTIFSKKN